MKHSKLASLEVNGDRLELFEGRARRHEKCVVVYFVGPEGWGITMNIRPDSLETFKGDEQLQRDFIRLAKDKLGLE
ncbi:hypothetical protein [Vibrio sp. AND4]|uniref:hypothetical protein n=1 Tax=Vibrio sp. AND4 TaxID=314289 RepID=UPI00015EFEDE|nr:hypothetical protein [Vibrio sp. AND4]EDP59461.1 hypothetical protein AND4_09817 [Vibrio sp. AND4]